MRIAYDKQTGRVKLFYWANDNKDLQYENVTEISDFNRFDRNEMVRNTTTTENEHVVFYYDESDESITATTEK